MAKPTTLTHPEQRRRTELSTLADKIKSAKHDLDMLRIRRDAKLYEWHEDGMSVEQLANWAGLTRQGAYDAIERIRAKIEQAQTTDLRRVQADWEERVESLLELQAGLDKVRAKFMPDEAALEKAQMAAIPGGIEKVQAKMEEMFPSKAAAEQLAAVERMRADSERVLQTVTDEANAAIEQARRQLEGFLAPN